MVPTRRWWQAIALFVVIVPPVSAQNPQFLPEVDVYTGLAHDMRFWFQAKDTREDGGSTQAEIGPSLDFYLKTAGKLATLTTFDLDDTKKRLLVLSVGYRYLPSPGNPTENRILLMATSNVPLKTALLLSDRNRLEINFKNGNTYWRYRNRVSLQRTFTVHSYHPSLNAMAEFYYNSQYGKWSDTALYVGCIFPLGKKTELNPYYQHQNNTGKSPNQQINGIGLILNLFFRREEK
jgi:Protein of unknown function (DUF2490)